MTPHPVPGHELDACVLRAQLAEIELILAARAPMPAAPWCLRRAGCTCWLHSVLRIIRYAP